MKVSQAYQSGESMEDQITKVRKEEKEHRKMTKELERIKQEAEEIDVKTYRRNRHEEMYKEIKQKIIEINHNR